MQHRTRQLQLGRHVGHAVLQRLEGADRHAELLAHLQVLGGDLDGLFHRPDQLGAQRHGAAGQAGAQCAEPLAGFAEQRVGADPDTLEGQLLDPAAVMQRQRLTGQPGAVGVDQQQADTRRAFDSRRDDERLGARRAQHQGLAAVQRKAVGIALRAQRHALRVAPRGGFAVGQGDPAGTVGQLRQQALLLRRRAAGHQRLRRQHRAAEVGFEHQPAAQLLADDRAVHQRAFEAAVGLGQRGHQPAVLGEQVPVLCAAIAATLQQRGARLEAVGLVDVAAHAVLQQFLLGRQFEIHACPLKIGTASWR
ncbi:hypothetical protein D9M68_290500 [compost metagenome]